MLKTVTHSRCSINNFYISLLPLWIFRPSFFLKINLKFCIIKIRILPQSYCYNSLFFFFFFLADTLNMWSALHQPPYSYHLKLCFTHCTSFKEHSQIWLPSSRGLFIAYNLSNFSATCSPVDCSLPLKVSFLSCLLWFDVFLCLSYFFKVSISVFPCSTISQTVCV